MRPSDPSQQSIVRYFPSGPVGRFLWPLALLVAFAATIWGSVATLRTVHFLCDRGAGTCSIVSSWGPLSTARTLPLASVKKTRLDSSHSKNSYSYQLALVTSTGDIQISSVASSSKSQRTEAKAQIDAFLVNPQATTLDVDYDEPSSAGFAMLALSLVWVLVGWAVSVSARVEIDRAERTCTVITVRWPLAPKRRVFRLDDVRDAVVTSRSGRGGATFSVGLVIDGETKPVPLVAVSFLGARVQGAHGGGDPRAPGYRFVAAMMCRERWRASA